ncbi:MAG: hypothetical protein ACRDGA_05055, partial [Bacteroidota bacterium]
MNDILHRLAEVRTLQLKTDALASALVFGTSLLLIFIAATLVELVGQFGSMARSILAAIVA